MDDKKTYLDLMWEIEATVTACKQILEDDCLGDMMTYLDEIKVSYPANVSDNRLRQIYKTIMVDKIRTLHNVAVSAIEQEILY